MNRKIFKLTYRIAAAVLLASVFTFAFVQARSTASRQLENAVQKPEASSESNRYGVSQITALRAEKRGFPLMNLQDGKRFRAKFVGADGAPNEFGAAQARALGLTNADLNRDGASDLIVGYADTSGDGGHLALYQGSLDTLSARTPEIFEGMDGCGFVLHIGANDQSSGHRDARRGKRRDFLCRRRSAGDN